jgi:aspartate carbamoyltransferase catalytic subunit
MPLYSRHLLGLSGMPREDIQLILDTAESFREVLDRPIKKVPTLQGKTIANMFFENSTRTRLSFELAERRLSADVLGFQSAGSSVGKGETLKDTARNIEAMKVDMVVMRHSAAGAPHYLSRVIDANVINAGDGAHEHPTQGLLDLYTVREKHGTLEGLHLCLVGDILHSRVARSNIHGFQTMGAKVSVCGPSTMIPRDIDRLGVDVYDDLDDVLPRVDVCPERPPDPART